MDINTTQSAPTTAPARIKLGRVSADKAYRVTNRDTNMRTMCQQMLSAKGHSARQHSRLFTKPSYHHGTGNLVALNKIASFGQQVATGQGKGQFAWLIPGGPGVHIAKGKVVVAPGTKAKAIAQSRVIVATS